MEALPPLTCDEDVSRHFEARLEAMPESTQDCDSDLIFMIRQTVSHYVDVWPLLPYLARIGVRESKQSPGMVSYFSNPEKAARNIRTRTKPGRFIKSLLPYLSDDKVGAFVREFKAKYSKPEYELIDSDEMHHFVTAYSGEQVRGTSPRYDAPHGYNVKSMAASCMRYQPSQWGQKVHPAAAYASGDFRVVYAKRKDTGAIGARVIVGNDSASYIYTECDFATKVIADYLHEQGLKTGPYFGGLTLRKIELPERGEGYFAMPYIDDYSNIGDMGEYFEIDSGDLSCSNTGGAVYVPPMETCDHCGCDCSADDMENAINADGDDCRVCYDCRRDYTWSDFQYTYIHNSICATAYKNEYSADDATVDWLESNGYVFSEEIDAYIPKTKAIQYGGEYFATWSDKLHKCPVRGILVHKEDIANAYEKKESWEFQWVMKKENSFDRVGNPTLEYTCKTEVSLRLNYQLDENGTPVRLPELPGIMW